MNKKLEEYIEKLPLHPDWGWNTPTNQNIRSGQLVKVIDTLRSSYDVDTKKDIIKYYAGKVRVTKKIFYVEKIDDLELSKIIELHELPLYQELLRIEHE